uniref:exodeoxyribonuclease III n=1 Tax=Xiphophorus couchianus TaxID=32473 RepID=A0A3B5KZT9_9TELE
MNNKTGLLNCISLNVRGINNPIKRKKVLTYFKKQSTDIAFIQETHLTDIEHLKLRRDWVGHVFYSSFSSKARGVALLINKNLTFRLNYMENDGFGRFILVDCVINTNRVILVSLYGPNLDNPEFFNDLILKLAAIEAPCILGDDGSNLLLLVTPSNTNLLLGVTSWCKLVTPTRFAVALAQGMKELGLGDVWRLRNPTCKDYSFYSNVHNTYSRIYMFLTSHPLLSQIKTCSYLAATISDHNPIQMKLEFHHPVSSSPRWRFREYLLRHPEFVTFMNAKIDMYLEVNLNTSSHSNIWEALKAYMKGHIISYVSHKNKQKREQLAQLEKDIRTLEIDHSKTKHPELLGVLKQKRISYDNLCTSKAEAAMARTKYHYYEFGNKTNQQMLCPPVKINYTKTEPSYSVIPNL